MIGVKSYHEVGKSQAAIVALAVVALCASATLSAAQNRRNAGTLTCRTNSGMGLSIHLGQRLRCHYVGSWGRLRGYSGIVTELRSGADLGRGDFTRWSVWVSGRRTARGALVGRYIAASVSGELGPGIAGNDLVGGAGRSIILRPSASSRDRSGANFAPEVTALTIDRQRAPRKREI